MAKIGKIRRLRCLNFAIFAMRAAWLRAISHTTPAFAPIFQILVAGRPPKSEKSGQTRTSKSEQTPKKTSNTQAEPRGAGLRGRPASQRSDDRTDAWPR